MLTSAAVTLTILAFVLSMILILWRPNGLNEAIPASAGAIVVLLSGTVTLSELGAIGSTISGAAITILATIVMAIVLESFGFLIGQRKDCLRERRDREYGCFGSLICYAS